MYHFFIFNLNLTLLLTRFCHIKLVISDVKLNTALYIIHYNSLTLQLFVLCDLTSKFFIKIVPGFHIFSGYAEICPFSETLRTLLSLFCRKMYSHKAQRKLQITSYCYFVFRNIICNYRERDETSWIAQPGEKISHFSF